MKLIDEHLEALKSGNPVRIHVEELGRDVVLILADASEDTVQVLEETLQDLREQRAVAEYARKVVSRTADDEAG